MLEKILFESRISLSDIWQIIYKNYKYFFIAGVLSSFATFLTLKYFYNFTVTEARVYVARKSKYEKSYKDMQFIFPPEVVVDLINHPFFIFKVRQRINDDFFPIYNDTIDAKIDLNHNVIIKVITKNEKIASRIISEAINLIVLDQDVWVKKKKFLIDPNLTTKLIEEPKTLAHYSNAKKISINILMVLISTISTFFYLYYRQPQKKK